jgi:hypothetical protein
MSAGDPIPDSDLRRLWILLFCTITVPFLDIEEIGREDRSVRSHRGQDSHLELFHYLVESHGKPDSEWSDYDRRRIGKLSERVRRLRK